MTPIKTRLTNQTLAAPGTWDAAVLGECLSLPVLRQDGVVYSYWKHTLWERVLILFGRPIRLAVVGVTHPPVAITVTDKAEL